MRPLIKSNSRLILFLGVLFLFAVAVRLAYVGLVVKFDSPPTYDGLTYDLSARNILGGKGYAFDENQPTAFRAPGYPFFVALVYQVFGASYAALRMVQVILGALTSVAIFFWCQTLFRRAVGFLAAFGVSLYPTLIFMTGEIYPETLFMFLLSAALVAMQVAFKRASGIMFALVGILFGTLMLIRPSSAPLVGLFAIGVFLVAQRRVALKTIGIVWLFAVLTILPWTIRNYSVFGDLVPFATQTGVNFWQGNNALANGGGVWPDRTTWPEQDPPDREILGWGNLSETESSRKFFDAGMAWVREHPDQAIALIPRKFLRIWDPMAFTTQSDRPAPKLPPVVVGIPYALFLCVVACGIFLSRARWRETFMLYALAIAVHISGLVFFAGTRYSLPMVPALIAFAAVGMDALIPQVLPWVNPRAAALASVK